MAQNTNSQQTLIDRCVEVLNKNSREAGYTIPSSGMYPHQWLWDSCFIAIGLSHISTERAQQEIAHLFSGQWHNGMVPSIIFSMENQYFADRNFWKSWASKDSPENIATSGITQPPLLAEAIWRIGQNMPATNRQIFFKKYLPKLIKYHSWLYQERDPHEEGLTLQIHPYETGLDNTPPWMQQLREHSRPFWIAMVEKLKLDKFLNVARRDTRHLPPEQRMTNVEALMLWDSVKRLRRKHYDINKIYHRPLFAIEDVAFNSIFIRNNQIIKDIALECRVKLGQNLLAKFKKSEQALEELWDETYAIYLSRDFLANKLIREPTIASLLPLYAGTIKKERADKLVKILTNDHSFWLKYPVPSVPKNLRSFDQNRYWQGPTWVNTNWLLIDGLARMGYQKEADHIKARTIELVDKEGMWEYFNPHTGQGLGSDNFSWTAALVIDLLKNKIT
jgi:neutral trehalase